MILVKFFKLLIKNLKKYWGIYSGKVEMDKSTYEYLKKEFNHLSLDAARQEKEKSNAVKLITSKKRTIH